MKTLIIFFFATMFAATACNETGKSKNEENSIRNVSPTDTSAMGPSSMYMDMHRQ